MIPSDQSRSPTPFGLGKALRRGLLLLAGLVALPALSAPPTAAQSAKPTRGNAVAARTADAGDSAALAKFHARLASLETATSGNSSRLNVLQIGDSHTAADHFSGRLRTLLQARFGNGGRGFLPPGAPHAYYRPYQVAVTQSAGWTTLTSNKTVPDAVPFGLSGFVARATAAGETITIDARSGADTLQIGYLRRPDGGNAELFLDGQLIGLIETRDPSNDRVDIQYSLGGFGSHGPGHPWHIVIKALGDGPLDITDVSLTNVRGLRLANLGFIGAQVSIMDRWNWPIVRAQLAELDPALIILAFGTNEGHAPVANIQARYARQLEDRIIALKAAAPNASIVVIGTPDANRYPKFCLPPAVPLQPAPAPATEPLAGEIPGAPASPTSRSAPPRAVSKAPPPEPPADAVCRPLDDSERATYEQMMADKDRRLCRWHTLPAIPVVRAIQQEVAARQGAVFFDWFALFEAECGADVWFRRGLAHKDRVHLRPDGYWRAADLLHARLLAGYPPAKH